MRKVSGPPSGAEYDYIPEVDGDPIVVHLKIPTEADKRRFGKAFRAALKVDDSGEVVKDSEGNVAVQIDQGAADQWRREMMIGCVVSVSDYTDSRGQAIKTGADLFEHGESEVVNLVVAEIQTGHTIEAEKKSASDKLSNSQSPATEPSDGTAENAKGGVSTRPEGAGPEAPPAPPSLPEPGNSPDAPSLG